MTSTSDYDSRLFPMSYISLANERKPLAVLLLRTNGHLAASGRNMEAKSGQKPINVLAKYLTSWIRENSDEALPFDSFEALRGGRIAQKNVERWIFNCNYLYNRVGDMLYDAELLPSDSSACAQLIQDIERSFKAISDNTPLDLRAKPTDAVVNELAKDWPPFCENSRNTRAHLDAAFARLQTLQPTFCAENAGALELIKQELLDEAAFYTNIAIQAGTGERALITRCRTLLPIWCAKEINPLVTLLIWDDGDAIAELADLLHAAFLQQRDAQAYAEETVDAWHEATLQAQASHLNELDDDSDLTLLSIRDIGLLLESTGFTLDHGEASSETPRWLLGKARLIWNIVICAIAGAGEAVGSPYHQEPTIQAEHALERTHSCQRTLEGEVLLRRRFRSGRVETIDRLLLDRVCTPGLWKVIGSHYDRCAPLPNSTFRSQFAHLGASFIASEAYDDAGRLVEGVGDSRFHVEISIEIDNQGRPQIIAGDLGSKNGTCVLRGTKTGIVCFAFPGRRHITQAHWAQQLSIPENSIHMVNALSLERGDIIQLADSCFELI